MGKRRTRKPKRPKYSPQKPLELTVALPGLEDVPPPAWRAAIVNPLRRFVESLPEVSDTAAGRKQAQLVRGVAGLSALLLVIAAKDGAWWLGAAGVAIAVSLVFVPVSGLRKARWRHRLNRAAGARQRWVMRPAALSFNGTKLTITEQGGGTWRSARPFISPFVAVWGARGGAAWLGIINPRGKKRDGIWFRCNHVPGVLESLAPLDGALSEHVDWTLDSNIEPAECDGPTFDALFAAFGPVPVAD